MLQRVRNLERRFDFSAPSVLTAGVELRPGLTLDIALKDKNSVWRLHYRSS